MIAVNTSGSVTWWLVVLPAFTGLAGAVIVAWYQGERQHTQWKTDARLKAYSNLQQVGGDFAYGVSQLSRDAKRANREEILARLGEIPAGVQHLSLAVSTVKMVGPRGMVGSAQGIIELLQPISDALGALVVDGKLAITDASLAQISQAGSDLSRGLVLFGASARKVLHAED